ncbi:sugar ABC transporter permease [Sphaerochaeta sp.]|jgi:oligogalacturonide transport system permease protein|uniref:carbohydrate ABC transporter permease n=1 Tax=Sphaerochaeta sp. TaxID=1972642 RepID=UPI002A36AAF3|nr:sugar ABC transporter permease [Sphaerochaeta sp.]MDX9984968.1 sugar ABC transporter permease [Sphaerochaeta sp.]
MKHSIFQGRKRKDLIGLVFVAPWVLGFLLFKAFPLLLSTILSFSEYRIISPPIFLGLENFRNAFSSPEFWNSMRVSFVYVVFTVPSKLAFSLLIAYILSSKVKGIGFFRSIYYIPSLMGGSVAVAILWQYMFMEKGMINKILGFLYLPTPTWLAGRYTAMFVIILLRLWQFGSTMVVFLAALKNMPVTLVEAAQVDGATRKRIFWSITIPYITPVIFFNLLTNLVTSFQEFNSPFVITAGGPSQATNLMSVLIYNNAFRYLKMGYSSALSLILFAVITSVTLLLFASSKRWVNYQD